MRLFSERVDPFSERAAWHTIAPYYPKIRDRVCFPVT